ncbi:MAG: TolB family protein, partial [Woeseiaceae bacterium]
MIKSRLITTVLVSVGLATAAADDSTWDNPEDIPVIEPVAVGLAGEKPADIVRYLMARGALQTSISPDGSRVAFSYRVTGEPQLWLVDASGGWPTQLTFGTGITFFRWAPDGQNLLVGRDANGNEREGYYLLSADGTRERQMLPLSDAFRRFGMFSKDGSRFLFSSTERNGKDFDIYVTDVASGSTKLLYEGRFGFFPAAWQPDGDLVIVNETRGEDGNDVHLLNMTTGKLTPLFQPEESAAYGNYAWLPDGSGFYLSTNEDREFATLAFYSVENEKLSLFDHPDADVGNVTLSGDGNYLGWTSNEDGYSVIHMMDRRGGEQIEIPALPPGVYSIGFGAASNELNIRVTGPSTPGDVFVWDIKSGKLSHTISSSLAGIDPESFVVP